MVKVQAAPSSPTNSGPFTFKQAADAYLVEVAAKRDLKPLTRIDCGNRVRAVRRYWPNENVPLNRQLGLQVAAWAENARTVPAATNPGARTRESPISARRFNALLDTLREVLKVAMKAGVIAQNPATAIEKETVRPAALRLPNRAEFPKLVAAIRGTGAGKSGHCADLIEFLAYSGCRIQEASQVRWTDCDLVNGRIRIAGDPVTGTKNWEIRTIPVIEPMRDLLERMGNHRDSTLGSELVLKVREAQKALEKACAEVGCERITHHDLRHLFATAVIESGVDIPTLSRWLGHKDGGVLAMKTYGHLRDEHSAEMAKRVRF